MPEEPEVCSVYAGKVQVGKLPKSLSERASIYDVGPEGMVILKQALLK